MAIWNTGKVEFDSGVGGSRVTRIGTQVAYAAAQEVKAELLQAASEALGVPTDRLAFTDGASPQPLRPARATHGRSCSSGWTAPSPARPSSRTRRSRP